MGEPGSEGFVVLAERVQACVERRDARLESSRIEFADLEGGVVTVEGAFGATDLLGERTPLLLERRLVLALFGGGDVEGVRSRVPPR